MLKDGYPDEVLKLPQLKTEHSGISIKTERHKHEYSIFVADQMHNPSTIISLYRDEIPGNVDLDAFYDKRRNVTILYLVDRRWEKILKLNYVVEIGYLRGRHIYENKFDKKIINFAFNKAELIMEEIDFIDAYKNIKKSLGIDLVVWSDAKYNVDRIAGRMGNYLFIEKPTTFSISTESSTNILDIWAARKLVNKGILSEPVKTESIGRQVSWTYSVLRIPTEDEIGFSYTSEIIAKDLNWKLKFKYVRHKMGLYLQNDGICKLCNLYYPYYGTTVDHIIPSSRCGTDDIENLQIACKTCNRLKSNLLEVDFHNKYSQEQLQIMGANERKKLIREWKQRPEKEAIKVLKKLKDDALRNQ